MTKKELEERLIIYAVNIVKLTNYNSTNYAGIHLSKQIIRSSTSSPLNYGEAQSSESKRDFIHKMKIILKELRETHICLRITIKAKLFSEGLKLDVAVKEVNELISIFVSSIKTAQKKS